MGETLVAGSDAGSSVAVSIGGGLADTRTREERSRIMAAVKGKDTAPELALRRALYAAGVRGWRIHYGRVPGKPDLAWPSLRVAVFVDGAFWHGHPSRHKPGRSGDYWDAKIASNEARDRRVDVELQSAGWSVLRVWDFEIRKKLPDAVSRVAVLLRSRFSETPTAQWQQRLSQLNPEDLRARS